MAEQLLQTDEYARVQAQLLPLLELEDDEAFQEASKEFLSQRLEELHTTAESRGELHALHGNFSGFILPDTEILPLASGAGYHLDDKGIYAQALPHLRNFYSHMMAGKDPSHSDKAYAQAMLYATQYTQQSYFGNVHNGPEAFGKREDLLMPDLTPEGGGVRSIAEFKGVAMCAERAAVANNILQLFGKKPVLEMGEAQMGNRPKLPHAYLFLRNSKGSEVVYDPTNPLLVFDESDALVRVDPAIYPAGSALGERDPDAPIIGAHRTFEVTPSGVQVRETEEHKYYLSPHGSELHPQ